VRLLVPLGQDSQPLVPGGQITYPTIGEQVTQGALTLTAMDATPISVSLGHVTKDFDAPIAGQTITVTAELQPTAEASVQIGSQLVSTDVKAASVDLDSARKLIEIEDVRFPVDQRGNADLARPDGRITLPARWWSRIIEGLGVGVRPNDRTVPWSYVSVGIRNLSDVPLNLGARIRVSQNDSPDPIFTPTMRDVDDGTGWVSGQIRVNARSHANLSLPLFVDERSLDEQNRDRAKRTLNVELSTIGDTSTIARHHMPLHIDRGSSVAAFGALLGLFGSLAGVLLIWFRGRKWLSLPTGTLVTVAMFSTLSFVVNAAAQLLGMGVSTILGPFAFLVTGLLNETIRACLLATLLFLRPRAGVCALAVIVGWLMRSVVLGAGGPTDLLYVSSHVAFLEGSLWLFGLTRGAPLNFVRIGTAFSVCFSISIVTALAFNVVLYRLFYADWYVLLNVAVSGVVFPFVAVWLAVPFARSLQRVED